MKLLAVCLGQGEPFAHKRGRTGIDKKATPLPVQVGPLGLLGDAVLNKKHHGGPDQATYIYTRPDYEAWADALGGVPEPGRFGENLLFSDLESASVCIGQRFQVGGVILEATAARIPCQTFAAHMQDPAFVRKFRQARRPGIYARVIQEGAVQAGDAVTLLEQPPQGTPTILDTFEYMYARKPTAEQMHRLLAAPISLRLRQDIEGRLAKLA